MRESTEYPEQLDGAVIFSGFDYKTALIGVSHNGRAVYDYHLMVEHLVTKEHFTEEEVVDWISYNTLSALPSSGTGISLSWFFCLMMMNYRYGEKRSQLSNE